MPRSSSMSLFAEMPVESSLSSENAISMQAGGTGRLDKKRLKLCPALPHFHACQICGSLHFKVKYSVCGGVPVCADGTLLSQMGAVGKAEVFIGENRMELIVQGV